MDTIATHARRVSYGENAGAVDPATATCARHVVASPTTREARTYCTPLDEPGEPIPCVICPHPWSDLVGETVQVTSTDGTYIYAGPGERPGGMRITVGIASGRPAAIECDYTDVAPADVEVPAKDARLTIEKLPRKRDYQDAGPWLYHLDLPGFDGHRKRAKRTKREAVATGLRYLAIHDWHARKGNR